MTWQPIETAPYNTKVLVVYHKTFSGITCSTTEGCKTITLPITQVGIGSQLKSRPGSFRVEGQDELVQPVYWMKLPAKPRLPMLNLLAFFPAHWFLMEPERWIDDTKLDDFLDEAFEKKGEESK